MEILLDTSTVADGNMSFNWGEKQEVEENRKRFLERISVPEDRCVVMEVNHGDTIMRVNASQGGTMVSGEALITTEQNLFLFLLTADCFPVAFQDAAKGIIALAHMGWPPTDKLLAKKVMRALKEEYGSNPEDVHVSLGPGIHKESYVFSDAITQKAPDKIDRWRPFLTDLPDSSTEVDIQGYILQQLAEEGVPLKNISPSKVNTATSNEYFSHYRAVRSGEKEGRFATVFGMRQESRK